MTTGGGVRRLDRMEWLLVSVMAFVMIGVAGFIASLWIWGPLSDCWQRTCS